MATPVVTAAGIAALGEMTKGALDRINALGDSLAEVLERVLADLKIKVQVTGYGSLPPNSLYPRTGHTCSSFPFASK